MPKQQSGKYEWRVPFGKEGEALNQDNFAAAFTDFCKASYAPGAKREKDETEMHYTQRVTETRTAAKVCADFAVKTIVGMLTHEQRLEIYNDAPDKAYIARSVKGKFNQLLKGPDTDYNKKSALAKTEGPDQAKYAAEVEAIDKAGTVLGDPNSTIEQVKEAVKDLLPPEKIEEVVDPANNVTPRFIIDNNEYVSGKLIGMLTAEQMQALKATVDNYVVPWERAPEEMGEKVYTAESEKAKADIDAMGNLSPEQKEAMKKDIDAANDYLLKPTEDPQSTYFALSTAYEVATLHDGEKAGEALMKKQGFDYDALNQEFNMETLTLDPMFNEAKKAEFDKWNEQEFKVSPKTKQSILTLVSKMREYGYGGKGVVGEQGTKEYGLGMLAATIKDYKKAVASGDASEIARASKAMMEEKGRVDEMLDFVRANFPVDRTADNFGKPGNVDVVRNDTFPPEYRYDEAVSTFNSVYMAMNFAESNGMTMEEFLDHPAKALRESYYGENAMGLHKGLAGKVGGNALFEASRGAQNVQLASKAYGAARAFEGFMFFDTDPAIREHNHGLNKFLYENVMQNAELNDAGRRVVAYTKGHLDRFLYVQEPREDASLLGIKIYDPKTFGYKQPEAFDEAKYLQTNGKSVGEMKEFFDNTLKEYYLNTKTQLIRSNLSNDLREQQALSDDKIVEIAQQAASKVLMAKYTEKDDPAYEQLKGVLTNGEDYVKNLIQAEKDKVLDAEQKLQEAQKAGDQKEIDRLTAYIDANKAFKNVNVQVTEPHTKCAENFASLEKKVAEFNEKNPTGADVKPDEAFNKSIVDMRAKLAELNTKIADITVKVGAMKSIMDDRVQLLNVQAKQLRSDIEKAKEEYIKGLDDAVKEGRIFASYKEARIKQLDDKEYKYDKLPDFFPTGDKKEIGAFLARRDGQEFGFVKTVPEVDEVEKVAEKQAEKQEEKQAEFTGRWFAPGQQVTNDNLLAKVKEINTRLSTPIVGDNWLENRKEYEANQREGERLNVVFNEGMKAISDETKQKMFDTLDKDSKARAVKFAIFAYSNLLKAEGKSEESKKIGEEIFDKSGDLTLEEVEKKAAEFLTDKEKADPSIKPYNKIEFDYISGKNPAAWEMLVKGIPEDKLRSVALKADATQTAMEKMTFDQAKEPRYAEEISSLKSTIDNMSYLGGKELTAARKAEIIKLLDSAQDMTSNLNKEYGKELSDVRLKREEGEYGYNVTRATIAQQKLAEEGYKTKVERGALDMEGVYSVDMVYQKGVSGGKVKMVTPEAREKIQSLKGRDFVIRPETQQAVKDIFAKFDKYGYDQHVFEPEEGTKVYALHKYKSAQEDFSAKIKSDDPLVRLQAIEAAQKMQVEYDRIKDLSKTAGEIFGVNEGGYYPGNVDVERTHSLPPEFRADLGGISALNGLYVLYRTLKERNVTPEELFADPRGFVEKMNQDSIDKQDINKSLKGKSGAEAMFEAVRSNGMIDPTAAYGINRAVETLAKMEKDPALREQNIVSEHAYSLSTGFRQKMAEQRDTTLEVSQRHLDRFLMVNKPCEDASLTGAASVRFDTFELIPPQDFNEVEYLMNNREDPRTYADRVVNEGCKFIAMNALDNSKRKGNLINFLPMERGFYAMQYAAIKFLACRPEIDKSSEAYRTLSAIAEGGPDHIKKLINQKIQKGELDIKTDSNAYELIDETKPTNYRVKQSLKDFKKSDAMRSFGDEYVNKDKNLNKDFKDLQKAVEQAQKAVGKAKSDVAKAEAQQQLGEAQKKLDEAIANRKKELLDAFRKGNITEDYLNKRNEQLDSRKFDENPPKMFEADQLKSKKDYLEEYAKRFDNPDDFNELSKEEKNELYQRYVEGANRAKEQFITEKYLEKEGALPKLDKKTMAERIAAEDKRLAIMEEAYGEKKKEAAEKEKKVEAPEAKKEEKVEEKKVENVSIDLEDEPEIQEKAEEKVEEKVEAKEKVAENDGERVDIDIDEDAVEMNNDILNFGGQEKNLEKSKGPVDK